MPRKRISTEPELLILQMKAVGINLNTVSWGRLLFLIQHFKNLSPIGLKQLLLVCGLVVGSCFPSDLRDEELTNEQILKNFEAAAFRVENEGQGGYVARDGTDLDFEWRLSKWMKPIRVGLAGKNWEKYIPWVDAHLSDLERLTGLAIKRVPGGKVSIAVMLSDDFLGDALGQYRSLFLKFYNDDAAIEKSMNGGNEYGVTTLCFAVSSAKKENPNRLIIGLVMIPINRSDEIVYQCIIEELTQALGLPNDADDIDPSIFNDNSSYVDLTESDQISVRMLYDPRMKPGMTWSEAEPIAREILRELRPGG